MQAFKKIFFHTPEAKLIWYSTTLLITPHKSLNHKLVPTLEAKGKNNTQCD